MLQIYYLIIYLVLEINCINVKETKPIINKCCAFGKIIHFRRCVNYDDRSKFTEVVFYGKKYMITNESLGTAFDIVPDKFKDDFRRRAVNVLKLYNINNFYLTKESLLVIETSNIYDRFEEFRSDNFCLDYTRNHDDEIKPTFWVQFEEKDWIVVDPKFPLDFITIAMSISAVFLFMVMIVYALLPELWNLRGLMLMAYVSSLFVAFILFTTISSVFDQYYDNTCVNLTCAIYFFHLATFCWMNVMSCDIWWTLSHMTCHMTVHRNREWFKFTMYSIYGYGLPLAMTVFLRVINDVDLTDKPWFIKPCIPHCGCYLNGGQKLMYLYVPMFILMVISLIFYLMTAFNVWKVNRGNAALQLAAVTIPKQRLPVFVFLKLSVVVCLEFIFDAVFYVGFPHWKLQWISDTYTMLLGAMIFVILICKPKILRRIADLLKNFKTWMRSSSGIMPPQNASN